MHLDRQNGNEKCNFYQHVSANNNEIYFQRQNPRESYLPLVLLIVSKTREFIACTCAEL